MIKSLEIKSHGLKPHGNKFRRETTHCQRVARWKFMFCIVLTSTVFVAMVLQNGNIPQRTLRRLLKAIEKENSQGVLWRYEQTLWKKILNIKHDTGIVVVPGTWECIRKDPPASKGKCSRYECQNNRKLNYYCRMCRGRFCSKDCVNSIVWMKQKGGSKWNKKRTCQRCHDELIRYYTQMKIRKGNRSAAASDYTKQVGDICIPMRNINSEVRKLLRNFTSKTEENESEDEKRSILEQYRKDIVNPLIRAFKVTTEATKKCRSSLTEILKRELEAEKYVNKEVDVQEWFKTMGIYPVN